MPWPYIDFICANSRTLGSDSHKMKVPNVVPSLMMFQTWPLVVSKSDTGFLPEIILSKCYWWLWECLSPVCDMMVVWFCNAAMWGINTVVVTAVESTSWARIQALITLYPHLIYVPCMIWVSDLCILIRSAFGGCHLLCCFHFVCHLSDITDCQFCCQWPTSVPESTVVSFSTEQPYSDAMWGHLANDLLIFLVWLWSVLKSSWYVD